MSIERELHVSTPYEFLMIYNYINNVSQVQELRFPFNPLSPKPR